MMKKVIVFVALLAVLFCSCSHKKTEGRINYIIEYQLPDSLKQYAAYLPKQATVYFKGDSTISIQQGTDESTSVVTDAKTGFMRALLISKTRHYAVDYDKAAQAEEVAAMATFTYTKTDQTATIAGYTATKYILKDKATGEPAVAWFTRDVVVIPNSLTSTLDTTLGVPLIFTLKQNGIAVKNSVSEIRFEPVPPAIFSTPKGYEFLTPQQFKDMSAGN